MNLSDERIALTHEDASEWNRKLLDKCISTKRNILLERVFKDAQKLRGILQRLRAEGYVIKFCVVAVHERYSVWGIHERYERERVERGHGRFVPIDYHTECYQRLLDSVDMIEAESAVDRLEIFNRGGVLIMEHDFEPNTSPANAKTTIESSSIRARVGASLRIHE
jgi:hypothetical protein